MLRVVVTGPDGLVIEAAGAKGPDPEFLAAEIAGLARAMGGFAEALRDPLRRFVVTLGERELLVVCEGGVCLGALIRRGPERKRVGQELSRLASVLAREYGGEGR